MKFPALSVLLACAAALGLPAWSARALDPSLFNDGFAPLTPAVAQFFLDLEAIPAGSTVTDAQHQTLVADLAALPPGGEVPSAEDLDKLATDFGALAVAGLVNDDLEYLLAMDFDVDYDDPDPWLPYVQSDVSFALNPPPPYDPSNPGDPNDPGWIDPVIFETAVPTAVRMPRPVRLVTRVVASLSPTYWHDGADQTRTAYSGSVRLTNLSLNNTLPVPSLRISTVGLPLGQTYRVDAVRKSDGASLRLGKFRARRSGQTAPPPALPGAGSALPVAQLDTVGNVTFGGQAKRRLPDGFNVNGVALVTVSDAQGRTVLSRDLSAGDTTAGHVRRVRLPLEAQGVAAALAKGTAVSAARTDAGATASQQSFLFIGKHLPANASVTLTINGTPAGQYTTTPQGRLVVSQEPDPQWSLSTGHLVSGANPLTVKGDWTNLKSVSVADAQGNVLLSGAR